MTRTEVASLAVRVISTYFLISYVTGFPAELYYAFLASSPWDVQGTWIQFAALIMRTVIAIVLCILINLHSNRIARWFIIHDDTPFTSDAIQPKDAASIAFSCIGLLCIIGACPAIVQNLAQPLFAIIARESVAEHLSRDNLSWLLARCFQLFVGIALIIKVKGLTGIWQKYRQ